VAKFRSEQRKLCEVLVNGRVVRTYSKVRRLVSQSAIRVRGEKVKSSNHRVETWDRVRIGNREFIVRGNGIEEVTATGKDQS
jgi:hypothetical protein